MTTQAEAVSQRQHEAAHKGCNLPPPHLRQELRRIAGLTQEDIAAEFGVSDGAVSYWERRKPGRRYMGKYLRLLLGWAESATAMGIPVGWPTQQSIDPQR